MSVGDDLMPQRAPATLFSRFFVAVVLRAGLLNR
jgi:hypothetical protein